ncbi:MAG: metallophosphoesterase [Candidatus Nanohaloarchaea archaeon]
MEELRIALLADFHYGYPEDEEMEKYLVPAVENMIEEVNEFEPDVVISLGDFIQHSSRKTDLERLEKAGELLDQAEAPVYAIPGNHDPMTVSKEEVMEKISVENQETYFSLELDERKLIFVDTIAQIDDIYGAGLIGSEQREWLEEEMETGKEVLIFSHHLLHHRNLEGNWYFDDKPELAAAIDKKNFQKIAGEKPRAVFSAHIHEAGAEEFNEVPHFTTPGMDKYNPPESFEENHALVTVTDGEIKFETQGETYRSE